MRGTAPRAGNHLAGLRAAADRAPEARPVASHTRTPPGTGIIAGPGPKEPAPAPSRPPRGRQSPARRPTARSPSVPPPTRSRSRSPSAPPAARPARQPPAPDRRARPGSPLAVAPPPGEQQVGVHVVAPRHERYRNPRLVALRHEPEPLSLAPATATGNQARGPNPIPLIQIRHCDRVHLNPDGHLTGDHSRSHSVVTSR